MQVLVTGGTGFIGAQICRACLSRGDHVRVLRRASSSLKALDGLPIDYHVGDLLDRTAVARAVDGCDLVFHVAAIAGYWRVPREQLERVNVAGTRVVMEACLQAATPRVVHTSSTAAIGIADHGPADETTAFDPLSATFGYAVSKHRAEQVVAEAVARGLAAVTVNPAVVIGAGDHYLNSGSLVLAYSRGRIPLVPPGGACVADVAAVTQGHLLAASHGRVGERYILGGENLSYRQIAAQVAAAAGARPARLVIPARLLGLAAHAIEAVNRVRRGAPIVSGEQVRLSAVNFFFDSGKAVRELGYPLLPFRGAVDAALRWYRANGYSAH